MYGYHRVSGNTNSILFDVTNADFTNGAQPKVTLLVWYLDDTNGSFNVYYNSSTGERLARTFYTTNGDNTWTSKTIPVTNARFNSATNDIRIEVVSGDPVFCQVGVISTIFLGLPASATNSPTLYDIWANTYGGSSLIGSPTTDYDGDRLSNLGEYALGGNPTNRLDSGTAPVLVNASGTMLYIHPKRASDGNLVYTIETSTNLVSGSWINASYIITGTNVTGTGLNYLTNALTTNGKEAYYRLKIQMN
jgi:hypothetical protein